MNRSNFGWSTIAAGLLAMGSLGVDICSAQSPPAGGAGAPGGSAGSAGAPGAPGADAGSGGGSPQAGVITPKKPPGYPDGKGSEAFMPGGAKGPKVGGGAGGGSSVAGADGGGPGAAGGPGGPGGPGGVGGEVKHDYKTPVSGATTFLSAVKSRKVEDVAQALAKRSEYEAEVKKQGMFKEILHNENKNAAEYVGQLAGEFEGMSVQSMNDFKSSASVKVVVGKKTKTSSIHRTLTMRYEKDGWKVQDYSRAMEMKNAVMGNNRGKKK